MKKCDIIIPVYNAPQWVKLCVYALFENTDDEIINKVIMIDDCSNHKTKTLLKNLKNKYSKIEVITNKENLGFVKNCNLAFKKSTADYALLLNTDCLVSKNTIEKLIEHCEKDKKIGLICPISSNAANLTLDIFEGFNYSQMNALLEKKFKGITFDACTVVGNCLMITKQCLKKTGYLDEIYGTGYGEETDYQFNAMSKGFSAKVAIDTYVFHKSEVSFGTSKEKQEKLNKNREIFFERYGKEYKILNKEYEKNDPVKYIHDNLSEEDKKIEVETVFYLTDLVQNAGGVHIVVDLINYLSIKNMSVNIICNNITNYKEIMLFSPLDINKYEEYNFSKIVSTIYSSVFLAKKISEAKKIPLLYFVQGYETLFENGYVYGNVELTYKVVDDILCVSKYLQNEIKENFNISSTLISNGINYDLLYEEKTNKKAKVITLILRNNVMKGDWILLDILKKMTNRLNNIEINVIYMSDYISFPANNNKTIKINTFKGPLSREEISNILINSDIFVDASLNEGFGLLPLEAMASGCVPVISNSFGVDDYLKNSVNGFIIDQVNVPNKYVEKIEYITNNEEVFLKMRKQAYNTAHQFDYDNIVERYIAYFSQKHIIKTSESEFTEEEKKMIQVQEQTEIQTNNVNRKVKFIARLVPKKLKSFMKKVITKLYNMYSH